MFNATWLSVSCPPPPSPLPPPAMPLTFDWDSSVLMLKSTSVRTIHTGASCHFGFTVLTDIYNYTVRDNSSAETFPAYNREDFEMGPAEELIPWRNGGPLSFGALEGRYILSSHVHEWTECSLRLTKTYRRHLGSTYADTFSNQREGRAYTGNWQ